MSDGDDLRLWTVDEARAYLPRLRTLLGVLRGRVDMAARARSNGHGMAPARPSGTSGRGTGSREADTTGTGTTGADPTGDTGPVPDAASALSELESAGIVLRALDRGLVDFPARHPGGRLVLLCWQVGEDDLAWWHLPEDGFAGRRPLPLPQDL